jgi:hypothetical protein
MDRNGSLTLTQSAFSLLVKKLAKLQLMVYDNALGKRLSLTKKKRRLGFAEGEPLLSLLFAFY